MWSPCPVFFKTKFWFVFHLTVFFHFHLFSQIGDRTGEAAAQMNLDDIRTCLGLPPSTPLHQTPDEKRASSSSIRRTSMEKMDLIKVLSLTSHLSSFPPLFLTFSSPLHQTPDEKRASSSSIRRTSMEKMDLIKLLLPLR